MCLGKMENGTGGEERWGGVKKKTLDAGRGGCQGRNSIPERWHTTREEKSSKNFHEKTRENNPMPGKKENKERGTQEYNDAVQAKNVCGVSKWEKDRQLRHTWAEKKEEGIKIKGRERRWSVGQGGKLRSYRLVLGSNTKGQLCGTIRRKEAGDGTDEKPVTSVTGDGGTAKTTIIM